MRGKYELFEFQTPSALYMKVILENYLIAWMINQRMMMKFDRG